MGTFEGADAHHQDVAVHGLIGRVRGPWEPVYFTKEKNRHNGFVAVGTVQIHIGTADSEKSDEQRKNHGCLGYIEDLLPRYIGIMINHYMDPYQKTRILESNSFFFGWQRCIQMIFNFELAGLVNARVSPT